MPYPNYINFISPSEKVLSSVANRPSRELALRTEELKARLDTAELGQAVILYDVPIVADAVIGSPVYWNSTNKQFELAYAQAELDTTYNEFVKSECANCIGLVYRKESATSGHIVIGGVVNLKDIKDIFIEQGTGRFYLSTIPGKLTHSILGVCVPVGTIIGSLNECDTSFRVYINPALNELWSHLHYVIDLVPKYVDTILEEGWRTVGEDDTAAPADAVYVYNILENTPLHKLFPPIPIDACSLHIDWNDLDETVGIKEIPVNCPNCLARITNSGIYWVNDTILPFAPSTTFTINIFDAVDGATWNANDIVIIDNYQYVVQDQVTNKELSDLIYEDIVNNKSGVISGWTIYKTDDDTDSRLVFYKSGYAIPDLSISTTNSTKIVEMDKNVRIMREKLCMSKTQFTNKENCVTSLRPYKEHPFEFVNCRGETAYAGDLYAKFTLDKDPIYITEYEGFSVRKFNDDWKQEIVPAVNAIAIHGDTASIVSNTTPITVDGTSYYRGLIDISIKPLNKAEISPQIMKLGDALEREINGIMYVGFPRSRESSILAKFEIPKTVTGNISFNALFYSSISGEYPTLTCKYKVIPAGSTTAINNLVEKDLYWDTNDGTTAGISVRANSSFELATRSISINPGDTIMLRITREATTVNYAGDAGIIRLNGILEV